MSRNPRGEGVKDQESVFCLFSDLVYLFVCVCACICVHICAFVCLQVHMQEPDKGIGSLKVRETDAGRDAQFVTRTPESKLMIA